MSKDHIFIVPSNDELKIIFELYGFKTILVIDLAWPFNVSTKPPAKDQTLISVSKLPVITNLALGEYTQHVIAKR